MRQIGVTISCFIRQLAERVDLIYVVLEVVHDVEQKTVLDGDIVVCLVVRSEESTKDCGKDIIESVCSDRIGDLVLVFGVQRGKHGAECAQKIGAVAQNRVLGTNLLTNLIQHCGQRVGRLDGEAHAVESEWRGF